MALLCQGLVSNPELKNHSIILSFVREDNDTFNETRKAFTAFSDNERAKIFTSYSSEIKGLGLLSLDSKQLTISAHNSSRKGVRTNLKNSGHGTLSGGSSHHGAILVSSLMLPAGAEPPSTILEAVTSVKQRVEAVVEAAVGLLHDAYSTIHSQTCLVSGELEEYSNAHNDWTTTILSFLHDREGDTLFQASSIVTSNDLKFLRTFDESDPSACLEFVLRCREEDLAATIKTVKILGSAADDLTHERVAQDIQRRRLEKAAAKTNDLKAVAEQENRQEELQDATRRSGEECVLTGVRLLRDWEYSQTLWVRHARTALLSFALARRDAHRRAAQRLTDIMAREFDALTTAFKTHKEDPLVLTGFRYSVAVPQTRWGSKIETKKAPGVRRKGRSASPLNPLSVSRRQGAEKDAPPEASSHDDSETTPRRTKGLSSAASTPEQCANHDRSLGRPVVLAPEPRSSSPIRSAPIQYTTSQGRSKSPSKNVPTAALQNEGARSTIAKLMKPVSPRALPASSVSSQQTPQRRPSRRHSKKLSASPGRSMKAKANA